MPSDVSEREQQDVATEGPTQKKYDRNKEATWYKKKDAPKILFVAKRDLLPLEFYKPGQKKEGLVPVHPYWRAPAWILCHSLPILFFQILWYHFFPSTKWNTFFYWGYLFIAHAIFLGRLIRNLHWWIKFYGVLDTENSGRDIPRDPEAYKMSCDIFVYNLVRTAGVVFLGGYNPDVPPSFGFTDAAITPFTAVKMALWFLALDFFFYSYHRACHEVPSLWRIHSKHHATRHPTPLQAILASDFQEFLEIAVIPFLATYLVPMNSYELWLVMCTLVYIEALGHTGARAYWGHPILHPILDPFSLALVIEDHDLHHRNGKSGKCFGKQSLLWDKLFGTVGKRIECVNEKVAF